MRTRTIMVLLTTGLSLLIAGTAAVASARAAFGLNGLSVAIEAEDGSPMTQAGIHPFGLTTTINANTKMEGSREVPDGEVRNLRGQLPAGLIGNPTAVPRCSEREFLEIDTELILPGCANADAVGVAQLRIGFGEPTYVDAPVYNLAPSPGEVARLGFIAISGLPITVDLRVSPNPPHNVVFSVSNTSQSAFFYGSKLTVWGNPVSVAHDPYRGDCLDTLDETPEVLASKGSCHVSIPERPFLTLPTRCDGPLATTISAESWQRPPGLFEQTVHTPELPAEVGLTGCSALRFAPTIAAKPTTAAASSATGLAFSLDVEGDEGLASPGGNSDSDIEKAVVTLPEGMTANPSPANGLGVCTEGAARSDERLHRSRGRLPRRLQAGLRRSRNAAAGRQAAEGRPLSRQAVREPRAHAASPVSGDPGPRTGHLHHPADEGGTGPEHGPARHHGRRNRPGAALPRARALPRRGSQPAGHPAGLRHAPGEGDALPLLGWAGGRIDLELRDRRGLGRRRRARAGRSTFNPGFRPAR